LTDLTRDFYRADALTLARQLIGKTLVHRTEHGEICGIISEAEAYMGVTDRACHAFGGRRTKRTETMYMDGGHAYVYLIYGMYSCMNITANSVGVPEAVLIRAVMPIGGEELLYANVKRTSRRKNLPDSCLGLSKAEMYSFADGPGKLCNAMGISREHDGCDMMGDRLFVRDDGWQAEKIICAPRIGIDYAGEAASYPWRFTADAVGNVPIFTKKT